MRLGPGVVQCNVRQTCVLQECERHKEKEADYVSILSLLSGNLTGCMLVKSWAEALQVQPRFRNTYDYILGISSEIPVDCFS